MQPLKIFSVVGAVNKDSLSEKINNEIVARLMKTHPNSQLTQLHVSKSEFSQNSLGANNIDTFYADVNSENWIQTLHESDVLVLSTPMTNFSYTAGIKNFIDAVAVANKTFSYKYSTNGGSIGLLDKLKVILVGTQGAPIDWYPFGAFLDNLKGIFNFFGAPQIQTLMVDGNKVKPRSEMMHEDIIAEIDDKIAEVVSNID
ncbi:acyl carrier protein phosphodiesterase [Mycoplasmopsis californica HAZ160_1]|nr:FMN-dependent NADH-azoreductase [Mycoplasmopsis californica]BAP01239.1 acyl carrier protein phosphodiesterase [Mycoplasmopsis californica HAZ160_1]BBG41112.1 acyl carrier protein phosphodiesterase [Mycoplasmopsis californica]BBG41705.1 acyl carrier protein phosphodiesterase [Mycoplasmopsis californica]BBG42299.1 acyl carrier protein phosphodiesterase [Mycoplasmopsis californica]BBG42875.1 acyl carrier protein phosphodiesterase [Mycoplasmopsis californica]